MKRYISFLVILFALSYSGYTQVGKDQLALQAVNSLQEELHPLISADGTMLFFSREGHERNIGKGEDVWVAYKMASGNWSKPVNVGSPINSLDDEEVVGLKVSNHTIYLYRTKEGALYESVKEGRSWSTPVYQPLPTDRTPTSVDLSYDGHTLLLSIPEANGKEDVYVSFRQSDNRWSELIHCGNQINSTKRDINPFLASDNKTIYFASDRSGGIGGFDLYQSVRMDNSWKNWTPPTLLDMSINTAEDELTPTIPAKGDQIYFSRSGNLYNYHLPLSLRPEPVTMVKGQVQHQSSHHATPATIQIEKQFSDNTEALKTNSDGSYQIIIPQGDHVNLLAEVDGFFPISEPIVENGIPVETLDTQEVPLMVSLKNNIAYKERDEEIRNLQLHIRVLDEEMLEIQRQRKAYLDGLNEKKGAIVDRSLLTDPELDALRHRFNYHVQASPEAVAQDSLPIDYNTAEDTKHDVEDMKTRYMRFYENEQRIQEDKERETQGPKFLWEDQRPTYDEVEAEIISELEAEVRPEIERNLSNQMVSKVAAEVQSELSPLERQYVNMEPELLKAEIREGLQGNQPRQWTKKGSENETSWERELKQDLRKTLEAPVKHELRTALEEEVKDRLKVDIAFLAKQKAKNSVERELNEKLKEQMDAESNLRGVPYAAEEEVKPLIPLPDIERKSKKDYKEIQKNLLLVPAEVGMLIELNTVSFVPNEKNLSPTAYPELNRVLTFLQKNDNLIVEFGVHTGGQLSHTTAQRLSKARANEIRQFLSANGIESERIMVRGYGKSLPIADNGTRKGQIRNQRVEMYIVGIQ